MDLEKIVTLFARKKDFKIIKEDEAQTLMREKACADNCEPEETSKRTDIRKAARKMDYESGKDF